MKQGIRILWLAAWLAPFVHPSNSHGETLKVVVDGIQSAKGQVQLSLENSSAGYYGKTKPLTVATTSAAVGQVEFEFVDLPPGVYSVKAFHDENANSELDLSLIGIPKEAYGISNNARAALGMPSYEEAAFELAGRREIQLTVKKHIAF
jgi:uncharacterized protein (DUF2141 family)